MDYWHWLKKPAADDCMNKNTLYGPKRYTGTLGADAWMYVLFTQMHDSTYSDGANLD
jgi:hypothetical protein